MLRVYQAETGRAFEVTIGATDTVESLSLKLADPSVAGLAPQQQVLLNTSGAKLVNRNLVSEYENDVVFLFSKLTSTSNPPVVIVPSVEVKAPLFESLKFPSELEVSTTTANKPLVELSRRFYFHLKISEALICASKARFDILVQLISERAIQIQAIQAVINNLKDHHKKNDHALEIFTREYQRQVGSLESIVQSFDDDLQRLKITPLHPSLRTPARNTLFDFVLEGRLRQGLDTCTKDFAHFKGKVEELELMSRSLDNRVKTECTTLASNFDIQHLQADINAVMQEQTAIHTVMLHDFQQIQQHVSPGNKQPTTGGVGADILEAFKSMYSRHETELIKNMQTIDYKLSRAVTLCAEEKNKATQQLFDKMRSISALQSDISTFGRKVTTSIHALNELKQKLFQFVVVHNLPEGYVLSLIESFRRYQFNRHYLGEVFQISEYLAKLHANEEAKREKFKKAYEKYIPQGVFTEFADVLPNFKYPIPELREPRIHDLEELYTYGVDGDSIKKFLTKLSAQPDENGTRIEGLFYEKSQSLFYRAASTPVAPSKTADDIEKEANISELMHQLEAQNQEYGIHVTELNQQMESLREENGVLQQQLLQHQQQQQQAEQKQPPCDFSEFEHALQRIAMLEAENRETHDLYATALNEIEKQMANLTKMQNEVAQCHLRISEITGALQQAREGETRQKQTVDSLKAHIAELEEAQSALERQRQADRAEQERLVAQVASLQQQLQQSESGRSTALASLAKMSDDVRKLESEKQDLQSNLQQTTETKESLRFQVAQLTPRVQSLDQEIRKKQSQSLADDSLLRHAREELEIMQKKYEYAEQHRHEHAQNNAHLEKKLFQSEQASQQMLSRFAGLLLGISNQLPDTAEVTALLDHAILSGDYASCFSDGRNKQLELLEPKVVQVVQEKIELSTKLHAGDCMVTFSNFKVTSNCIFCQDSRGNYMAIHRDCPNYFVSPQCVASLDGTNKRRLAAGGPPVSSSMPPKYVLGQIIYMEKRDATRDFPSALKEGTAYWCCDIEFL